MRLNSPAKNINFKTVESSIRSEFYETIDMYLNGDYFVLERLTSSIELSALSVIIGCLSIERE